MDRREFLIYTSSVFSFLLFPSLKIEKHKKLVPFHDSITTVYRPGFRPNKICSGVMVNTGLWEDVGLGGSRPFEDIKKAKIRFLENQGIFQDTSFYRGVVNLPWKEASVLRLTKQDAFLLGQHPDMKDLICYSHPDMWIEPYHIPKVIRGLIVEIIDG